MKALGRNGRTTYSAKKSYRLFIAEIMTNPNYKKPDNNYPPIIMKKFISILCCLCLVICYGCKDNKQIQFNIQMIDNDSQAAGSIQGWKDGKNGLPYKYGYNDHLQWYSDEPESVIAEYQEHYSIGYKKGYDEGYNQGKAKYNAELSKRQEAARQEVYDYDQISVTTTSTPNTYSSTQSYSSNLNSGSIHSNEGVYGNFYNYKETDYCVEGVVVYEGTGDYFIVETRKGYTVLEVYSGILYEGDKVRGELNKYHFNYLINRNRNSEVKVYIEDYMLSDDRALEWLGEHEHLKSDDQKAYNYNKNR